MSFFGAFFGAPASSSSSGSGSGSSSPPIPAPISITDPEYENHTARMIDRLPQFAKRKADV